MAWSCIINGSQISLCVFSTPKKIFDKNRELQLVVFQSSIIIENQSIAGIIQALDYKIFILINRFICIFVEFFI
jgi:hypothetical protein